MNATLDKLLCDKYPLMTANRDKSMQETAMCWGFECGDGWFNILNQLMGSIQHHTDWNNRQFNTYQIGQLIPQVTLDQVKEKYGTLRFYYTGGDDYISGMVSLAECMSAVTCEVCGSPGKLRGGGWTQTLCDEHYKD